MKKGEAISLYKKHHVYKNDESLDQFLILAKKFLLQFFNLIIFYITCKFLPSIVINIRKAGIDKVYINYI